MFRESSGGGEKIRTKKTAKEETSSFFVDLRESGNENLCKEKINDYISSIINDFSSGAKRKEDFKILMDKISLFREAGSMEDIYEIERSWSQEQVDFLIRNYNSYFMNDVQISRNDFGFFQAISTSRKKNQEDDTVSEKTARSIIKLIDENEIISLSLQENLAMIGQNIQMIRSQERFDLISKILENPGKIYNNVRYNLQAGVGLMDKEGDLMTEYEKRKNNLTEVIKIIEVLEFLIKISNNSGFKESGDNSLKLIDEIEKNNPNFFIQYKINLLRKNQKYDRELLQRYSEIEDKKIEPMDFWPIQSERSKQRVLPHYAYSKLADKYGVIYNDKGEIDSFFMIEGDEQERISLDEILSREGFEGKNMDPDEYEKLKITYRALIKPLMRNKIENEFRININDFKVREQVQFVNFLSLKKIEDVERIKQFSDNLESKDQKNNFIKSFLSLELDRDNGEKIVSIGEKLKIEDAGKIFAKITELSDLVQKKDEELSKIIYKDNQKELPASVQTELLRKAHNIISRFSDELKDGEKPNEEKIQKLLVELEQSRIEIDLVASLLIAGKKEGEVQNLEDIQGLEISEISGKEVLENSELIGKLREMYRANNSHKSKEDLERLMSDFEKHLEYDAKFYAVYFDKDGKSGDKKLENLVGFMRSSNFDGIKKLPEGERYLGAMNIDPLLQKFYFGDNFSRETNERELVSGAKKLIAHVPEGGRTYELLMEQGFKRVAQEGEYKNDDGSVLARRLRVELTKD